MIKIKNKQNEVTLYLKYKKLYYMKNINKIFWATFLVSIVFVSCDPNKDLYDTIDKGMDPHKETIEYTLTEADYDRFGGFIRDYSAFSDSLAAADFVPDVLKVRFPTLRDNSSALVTFNHFLLHPDWWDAGFGYELTEENYAWMGAGMYFTPENPAKNYIPDLLEINPAHLLIDVEDPEEGDSQNIIYNFRLDGEDYLYLDTYEFDGSKWVWIETQEKIPYVGYELTEEDYEKFGGNIANHNNFTEENPPQRYLPVFLRNLLPYAVENDEQVLKYNYFDGGATIEAIDKYYFDGNNWHEESYVEARTEQYIHSGIEWAFDPTVRFTMTSSDYLHIVTVDPIGQAEFPHADFAYYYGASAFYSNFDIRLIGRRLDKLESGDYVDTELAAIYDNEGREAAVDEMLRRIVEEGIVELLQYKYPDATPEVKGIEVNYYVRFQTFADNWIRRHPEAHYICTEAGTPPQFELIRGPYYPLEDEEE